MELDAGLFRTDAGLPSHSLEEGTARTVGPLGIQTTMESHSVKNHGMDGWSLYLLQRSLCFWSHDGSCSMEPKEGLSWTRPWTLDPTLDPTGVEASVFTGHHGPPKKPWF